jgi:ABC-type sugar transport system ATPase subunit/ribose/xylose/arabinose/galactoside ABC-type transport system permease subunit
MASGSSTPLAHLEGITKTFPGVRALGGVDLEVRPGEVHALVGENGAGKSTLMRILAGGEQPDEGSITWKGERAAFAGPGDALRAGISMIHQELSLIANLSVAENVFLGHERLRHARLVDWGRMNAEAEELLSSVGVSGGLSADTHAGRLPVAGRQMVEVAKALSWDVSLLIMDEPTASLGGTEVRALFDVISRLRERGVSVLYVSHRLEEILEIADRITVLRDGQVVRTLEASEASEELLIRLMVGRDLEEPTRGEGSPGEPILSVRGLRVPPKVEGFDLDVRAGEIVALWGLMGSGRSTVARALAGLVPAADGTVTVQGTPMPLSDPVGAVRSGVVYLTENRKEEGLVLDFSIRENAALASLPQRSAGGFVRADDEKRQVGALMEELDVRAASMETPVRTLSGGNQQKVVMARALLAGPRTLIVDEPTRGVDVGSKAEIHRLLRRVADDGNAVVVVSSELPEVLAVADRVVVVREGAVAADVPAEEAVEDELLSAATPGRRADVGDRTARKERRIAGGLPAALVLFALWGIAAALSPGFRSMINQANLLNQAAMLGLLTLGQTVVLLGRGIDLSVGATMTASLVVGATIMQGRDEAVLPAVGAAVAVGALVGLVNGLLVQRFRLQPFIATLGMAVIVQGLVLTWVRGPTGAAAPALFDFAGARVLGLPLLGLSAIALVVAVGLVLRHHVWGRRLYAVGGDPDSARLSGIRVDQVRVWSFVVCGVLASLAGLVALARFGAADPRVGAGLEFMSITAAIIGGVSFAGGRGTVWGALAGVGVLGIITNIINLLGVARFWQEVVTGLTILVAIYVFQRSRGREAESMT